ncbi:uncharacterized protein LOC144292215 [Canis aureus]
MVLWVWGPLNGVEQSHSHWKPVPPVFRMCAPPRDGPACPARSPCITGTNLRIGCLCTPGPTYIPASPESPLSFSHFSNPCPDAADPQSPSASPRCSHLPIPHSTEGREVRASPHAYRRDAGAPGPPDRARAEQGPGLGLEEVPERALQGVGRAEAKASRTKPTSGWAARGARGAKERPAGQLAGGSRGRRSSRFPGSLPPRLACALPCRSRLYPGLASPALGVASPGLLPNEAAPVRSTSPASPRVRFSPVGDHLRSVGLAFSSAGTLASLQPVWPPVCFLHGTWYIRQWEIFPRCGFCQRPPPAADCEQLEGTAWAHPSPSVSPAPALPRSLSLSLSGEQSGVAAQVNEYHVK